MPLSKHINHFAKLTDAATASSINIDLPLTGNSTLTIQAVVGGKVIDKEKVKSSETIDHAAARFHRRLREHKLVD